MKILKKLSATIAAIAIFGTSVMAADFKFDDEIKVAADATQVTVNVIANDNVTTMMMSSSIAVTYNKDVYTFNSNASSMPYSGTLLDMYDETVGNYVMWTAPDTADVVVGDGKTMFTLVFDINSEKNAVDTKFELVNDINIASALNPANDYAEFDVSNVSVTVTAKEVTPPAPPVDPEPPVTPEPPKPGDVIEVENKTAVIDDAGKTRFVVSATETNIPSTTAASVLKVTYDNVTKQANLYKLLGVEDLENAGTLTIGSLTVKVILGEDVTEASQVGAVSFVIQ